MSMPPLASFSSDAWPCVSGYSLVEELYAGARTTIYRGIEESSQRPVVVKLLHQDHPSFDDLLKFRNQYAITQNLDIPGIVHSYSLEPYGNSYVFVMEDVGGISLQQYKRDHELSLSAILAIALQLTHILQDLHQNQIIHKDLKPANILICPDSQQVKVIDFSIASRLPKETQEIKNPGNLEGTLAYLAPEQTGRMNRGIDYRSDFYALGITLFELLTGRLPFLSKDPMELVHCHLAKQPPRVDHLRPDIPAVVADMVNKLMAKDASDRYQSALGLQYDLQTCLSQLEATGQIEPFAIAMRDMGDRFLIPEKLYGRHSEVQALLMAFDRVVAGTTELMLVAGFSGIGKTAVVYEVHKPIVRQRGYFVKGKFDQFNRNIPLSAFVQALRDLMGQLLSESDAQLQTWQTQILLALGQQAQVIIDVIPELEQIIGPQPPAPELAGIAAQNRFNRLFQNFIQVFSTADHPLVIFLDDLQWADATSLRLIQLLMAEAEGGYLLLIGAYRDNEVSPTHPLMLTLEDLRKAQATITTLTLRPLLFESVNQLVADSLNDNPTAAQPLTELIYQKTQGNPFFTTQFLKSLHQDGLITFNADSGQWRWDFNEVWASALTNDVVDFMVAQLKKLPAATQDVLKLAACIGNGFDLATLAIAAQQPENTVAAWLWRPLQEGLILPTSKAYKVFQTGTAPAAATEEPPVTVGYRFLHDRIQQAAYSLIAEDQRQSTHLHLGQLLLQQTTAHEQEERLFEIVNHLNIGYSLIRSTAERLDLAQLNLTAARKAKAATAYGAAVAYLTTAIDLLPDGAWAEQYDLALALHTERVEAAYLNTDFGQMETWANQVLHQTQTLLDTIPIQQTRLMGAKAQGHLFESLQIGLQVLQTLGIEFPEQPTQADIGAAFATTRQLWQERSPLSLLDLPAMTNPYRLAAMEIMTVMVPSAYMTAPSLMLLLIFKQVELSIRHGNCPVSVFAYGDYGLILCGVIGDIPAGYDFGQLALKLLEQLHAVAFRSRSWFVVYSFVSHWQAPLQESLLHLRQAYQSGLETGDIECVALNANGYCFLAYLAGQELTGLATEMDCYRQTILHYKQTNALRYQEVYEQTVLNLIGQSQVPQELTGTVLDAARLLPEAQAANNRTVLFYFYCNQMILAYLFGDYRQAVQDARLTEQHLDGGVATFLVPLYYCYDALIQLAVATDTPPAERTVLLERVEQRQAQLHQWADYAPFNHQHRWQLVEAERCALMGDRLAAIEHYEQAIAQAQANGFQQDAALANELAARFYLTWGKDKVAAGYLQEAYYGYARWGAKAKTDDLEQRYPGLLRPILKPALQPVNVLETLATFAAPHQHATSDGSSNVSSGGSSSTSLNTALDFAAVLKASQSLSGTIQINDLLFQLVQIILQNSGGDRCALILPDPTGEWRVEAIATATPDDTQLCSEPLAGNSNLPLKLLQYVKNTQKVVVVDDLQTDLPILDDYLTQNRPRSVLCLPILNQGHLIGILYLRNQSISGVFSEDRVLVLNFLCTQAAISLENARLYEASQANTQRLEQALQNLQQAQLQLVQSEKMASLGNLVAGVAHEINNPIGFLKGSINNAKEFVHDLFDHLDLYQEQYSETLDPVRDHAASIDLDFLREDLPKLLESMTGASDRITAISHSLRTFSRADTDRKVNADLHEGIDSTLLILKYRLKGNQQRPAIQVIKDYGDLPLINCFPGQLNQVFMNILANAIDVFDEVAQETTYEQLEAQAQTIMIKTRSLLDQHQVEICIRDNGSGMTEEVRTQVFDHLFTTKEVGKGTGLGLAIAHQIVVESHGGTLEVESQLGQGSEFCIHLPIQDSEKP